MSKQLKEAAGDMSCVDTWALGRIFVHKIGIAIDIEML